MPVEVSINDVIQHEVNTRIRNFSSFRFIICSLVDLVWTQYLKLKSAPKGMQYFSFNYRDQQKQEIKAKLCILQRKA